MEFKIELHKDNNVLVQFEMGWKGIDITTNFNDIKKVYLLKMKGLLESRYVLINPDDRELLAAKVDFKWTKLGLDYTIETSDEFDSLENKDLLLITILHSLNYLTSMLIAAG